LITSAGGPAKSSWYLNFAGDEGRERVRSQFDPAVRARLAGLTAEWDPENVFRASGNQALVEERR
jgi:hypothetical protein